MTRKRALFVLSSIALCLSVYGQEAESTVDRPEHMALVDTIETIQPAKVIVVQPKVARYNFDAIPRDPVASFVFSLTFPGAGQIYNREYLRGILTAATFYGSVLTANYLINRWTALNTDTAHLQDYYNENTYYDVPVMKPDSEQVGLPTGEKLLLVTAAVLGVSSYVFGLVDAVMGAKRYNRKLTLGMLDDVKVEPVCGITKREVGVRVSCGF